MMLQINSKLDLLFLMKEFNLPFYYLFVDIQPYFILERIIISPKMSDSLCTKCQKFFGNPKNLNMCSVCYKQHLKSSEILKEASGLKPPAKQQDHSRCYACRKKIGLLGIRCKGCECSYCNAHRLPEDHKCEGDFIEMAKIEIKKNNPNITAPKIEKI